MEETCQHGSRRRIGVFGGSFDPVHVGHVLAAEDVRDALHLDEVLLIPAGVPPHKPEGTFAPALSRLEMVRLAVAGRDRLCASDVEVSREGVSYTVDTLRLLSKKTGADLFLVLGTDAARILGTWRKVEEVLRLARPVVVKRPGEAEPDWNELARTLPRGLADEIGRSTLALAHGFEVSSSEIRRLIASGRTAASLAPQMLNPAVAQYIDSHGLYRKGGR